MASYQPQQKKKVGKKFGERRILLHRRTFRTAFQGIATDCTTDSNAEETRKIKRPGQ
jgi:bisphosphoglycerate-dependent phosphoglycerate mutase